MMSCGNGDPTAFQAKSYEEVLQLCKENIEAGKDSPSGFILSPVCEMSPFAPTVNVMAMMDAAEMSGKYEQDAIPRESGYECELFRT